jgi:hypothetical protein
MTKSSKGNLTTDFCRAFNEPCAAIVALDPEGDRHARQSGGTDALGLNEVEMPVCG